MWEYGAVVQYSTITSDSDGNVVPVHHVKDVVHMIDSMPCIGPCIRANRNSLK